MIVTDRETGRQIVIHTDCQMDEQRYATERKLERGRMTDRWIDGRETDRWQRDRKTRR